jgi:hypothetical protein
MSRLRLGRVGIDHPKINATGEVPGLGSKLQAIGCICQLQSIACKVVKWAGAGVDKRGRL